MKTKSIKNLKDKVRRVLSLFPETRNSDIELTIRIWREHFPSKIVHSEKYNDDFVRLKDLFELPREDNIKRVRAVIQNVENEYLPTSSKIAEQRKINMDTWHKYMAWGK